MDHGTVIWITGLPSAGKTTLARGVHGALRRRGERVLWLDSDDLREVMTPAPTYSEAERDVFYATLAHVGRRAAQGGVFVVISATANRRRYRDAMREKVEGFFEVWVRCPDQLLRDRDPKGLYRQAAGAEIDNMPGAGAVYEPPTAPELIINTDQGAPEALITRVIAALWPDPPF